jgi:hypothetical protein
MGKNRIYAAIFILLLVLIVLLGGVNMLTGAVKKQEQASVAGVPMPTTFFAQPTQAASFTFPTRVPTPTVSPDSPPALKLSYPLKHETIAIDYLPVKKQMVIFYPQSRAEAEAAFGRFLSQNQASGSASLNVRVEYIGLTKEADEPTSGYGQ